MQQQHLNEMQLTLPKISVTVIKDPLMGQDIHIVLLKKEVIYFDKHWNFED